MATYSELKAQLTDTQFVVFLTLDANDPFKRVVAYENKFGLKGTLGAIGLGVADLTMEELPAVVEASVLANAIRKGSRVGVIWNTIEVASQTGVLNGEINQDSLDSVLETVNTMIDEKTRKVFRYRGRVDSLDALPVENNTEGDVYRVSSENDAEYVWVDGDNAHWEYIGAIPDLSDYYNRGEIDVLFASVPNNEDVTALNNALLQEVTDRGTAVDAVDTRVNELAESVDEKLLNYCKDYTAVEVLATNEVIPANTVDEITGLTYKRSVSMCMEATFKLRTICPTAESDVIVDFGDGYRFNVKDSDQANVEIDGNEYNVIVRHTYAEPGRYIVKFFGTKYFGFGSGVKNIVSRGFASDLPLASHVNSPGNLVKASDRILEVDVPTYMLTNDLWNCSGLLSGNVNMVKATGLRYFNADIRNLSYFIMGNPSLETTDFILPAYVRDGALDSAFANDVSLAVDIGKLFPASGFIGGGTYNVNKLFYNCGSLTGTVPASKLWENTNITWTNTSTAFVGCSESIRAQVPVSWGGTNTDIEAKLQSGYWNKIAKKDLATLESGVADLRAALDDARVPNVRFIDGGTVEEPVAIDLKAGVWYVAVSPFTGALPDSPSDGTVVQISYEHGQNNMKIVPSGNDTINGSPNPCLIGISGEGVLLETDSHRLVYRSGNWILL